MSREEAEPPLENHREHVVVFTILLASVLMLATACAVARSPSGASVPKTHPDIRVLSATSSGGVLHVRIGGSSQDLTFARVGVLTIGATTIKRPYDLQQNLLRGELRFAMGVPWVWDRTNTLIRVDKVQYMGYFSARLP